MICTTGALSTVLRLPVRLVQWWGHARGARARCGRCLVEERARVADLEDEDDETDAHRVKREEPLPEIVRRRDVDQARHDAHARRRLPVRFARPRSRAPPPAPCRVYKKRRTSPAMPALPDHSEAGRLRPEIGTLIGESNESSLIMVRGSTGRRSSRTVGEAVERERSILGP